MEGFFEQSCQYEVGADGSGGAALRRFFGAFDVIDRLVWSIGPNIEDHGLSYGRTDPGELANIELNLRPADQLIQIDAVTWITDGQPVRFGHTVDIIGSDHRSGAGHILNDHLGISRYVFRHEAR